MRNLYMEDAADYVSIVRRALLEPVNRTARGELTRDLGAVTIRLCEPRHALPLGVGRNLHPAIAAVEAAQLIAGVSRPKLVLKIAPQFERYVEKDGHFHGAYGQRIGMQMLSVERKLRADPGTRQAVVTLWDPWLDNVTGMSDYPCTVALNFYVRGGKLEMNTLMRSNDVWLGLPYDLFQFTQLQLSLANALACDVGYYYHTVWSLHLYERDTAKATMFTGTRQYDAHSEVYQPSGFGVFGKTFADVMTSARGVLDDAIPLENLTTSERWYRDRLHG